VTKPGQILVVSNTTKIESAKLVKAKTKALIAKLKLEAIKEYAALTKKAAKIKPIVNSDKTETHTVVVGGSVPGIDFVAFFPPSIKAKGWCVVTVPVLKCETYQNKPLWKLTVLLYISDVQF